MVSIPSNAHILYMSVAHIGTKILYRLNDSGQVVHFGTDRNVRVSFSHVPVCPQTRSGFYSTSFESRPFVSDVSHVLFSSSSTVSWTSGQGFSTSFATVFPSKFQLNKDFVTETTILYEILRR